jgi:HlyD family secretion protein
MSTQPSIATTQPTARRAKKARAWRRFIPWLLFAAVIAAIAMSFRPKPVEVETHVVGVGPLTVSVLEEGKTRIRHRYIISPPVMGFLERITLRAGDPIEAGKTVLARVQPQLPAFLDVRTKLESEARLKGAEAAKLGREAQIERARSALDLAEKDLVRIKKLRASGAVAARDLDAAEGQVAVLGRELRAAEFALQVAEFERAQAEAALTQNQTPQGTAAQPMEIIAPVTGHVLNVMEESARPVTPGMPLMEVGSPADLEAEIEMLSSDAVAVQPGAPVSIEQWGGDVPLRGRVTVVEPGGFTKVSALGVEEQRVKVRVEFTDPMPAGKVLGDRFRVEARTVIWQSDSVLQVPTGALFRRGNDWMTFVIKDGKAQEAKVQIGRNNGTIAEVREGLSKGDVVLLHPPDTLTAGAQVRPRGSAH